MSNHHLELILGLLIFINCQDYRNQNKWSGECLTGLKQSPINIQTKEIMPLESGTSMAIEIEEDDYIQVPYDHHNENLHTPYYLSTITLTTPSGQKTYNSVQFHFHQTSEHLIDGVSSDLEMHIVHSSKEKSFAVLSLLFKSQENILKDPFDDWHLDTKKGLSQQFPIGHQYFDSFYHYQGSLTTPTCNEGVQWFVRTQPIPVKPESMEKMRELIHRGHTNNRNVHTTNGRFIVKVNNQNHIPSEQSSQSSLLLAQCCLFALLMCLVVSYRGAKRQKSQQPKNSIYIDDGKSDGMFSTKSDLEMSLLTPGGGIANPELDEIVKRFS